VSVGEWERCACCGQVIQRHFGRPRADGELAGLPVRLANALERHGITSREQVAAMAISELTWVRGVGMAGLEAILRWRHNAPG
jgi:hypothetical protein